MSALISITYKVYDSYEPFFVAAIPATAHFWLGLWLFHAKQ